jgi:hypothetical protein
MSEEQDSTSETNNVTDFAEVRKRQQTDSRRQLEQDRHRRDEIVERLNNDFCVVNDHGAVWVFQEAGNPLRPGFRNIFRMKKTDFQTLLSNKLHPVLVAAPKVGDPDAVKIQIKSEADIWLQSRR